jgi:hypothetical protein
MVQAGQTAVVVLPGETTASSYIGERGLSAR